MSRPPYAQPPPGPLDVVLQFLGLGVFLFALAAICSGGSCAT